MQVSVDHLRGSVPCLLKVRAYAGTGEQLDERGPVQRPRPDAFAAGGQGAQDRPLMSPQDLDLVAELGEPDSQRRDELWRLGVQRPPDLSQREACLSQAADRGQSRDVVAVVDPVARSRARRRSKQPESVVVEQRGPRQAEPGGEPPDRQRVAVSGVDPAANRLPVLR